MFKKTFLLVAGLVQISSAMSLENILDLVEKNNYTVKEKQTLIKSSKINEKLSFTWKNPIFGFGVNDINLDDVGARDLEAMQTQYITYSQVIPTNGKLELENTIKKFDTNIKQLELASFKQKIKSQALFYSYSIVFEKEKIEILNKYINNLNKQKELMTLLYENGKIDQTQLVSIDIKIYKLKLKKQKITYAVEKQKSNLENIVYAKIDTIEVDKSINSFIINKDKVLKNHPLILIKNQKLQQQNQKIKLEEKKRFSDVKLTVGYYDREKFDDYMSFNIAIPLGVQGREKLKIHKSKIDKKSITEDLESLKQKFKTTMSDLENKIKMSQLNIELIENKMIPLNNTLEESHKIHLSTNRMQSLNVYESRNSKYELLLLVDDEKISYFDAYSKLQYFKGNL
jgi:outer membrane protein TolC